VQKNLKKDKTGCNLGCSHHALVEFSILRCTRQIKSRVKTLDFRRANFLLFRALVHGIPWETALRSKGAKENWETFKDIFLSVEEISILTCKDSSRGGRRSSWLSQDLLAKLKYKPKCTGSEGRDIIWGYYKDITWQCKEGISKAKAQLKLNVARDVKNNKKDFCRYIG